MMKNQVWAVCLCAVLLSACGSGQAQDRTAQPTVTRSIPFLTAYSASTTTPTPRQVTPTEIPPVPTPTPTPRTHTVRQGEDMFGIALLYGVNLDELRTANPTVMPNFLSIGTVLLIPGTAVAPPEPQPDVLQSPTAVSMQVGTLACYPTADGGAWCFLPVSNPSERALESVSAVIRLGDDAGQEIAAQSAYPPLDLLPPGAALPLSAYFAPPLPAGFRGSAEITRALTYPEDGRYVPAQLKNQQVRLPQDGLSAEIICDVLLADTAGGAQRVWLAAVAYDAQGNMVGVRRWENPEGEGLSGSQPLNARFWVYSAAGPIARVEVLAEARP